MTRRNAIIKVLRAGAKASHFQKKANPEAAACIFLIESSRWENTDDKPKVFQAALAVIMEDVRRSQISANNVGIFRPVTGRRRATTITASA
jgi:hypothetical protein